MRVAGVVVTYDRPDMLKLCLESMAEQSTPPKRIVVIDNSPNENTRRVIEKYFPFVTYKHFPENIGSEGGYREGVRLAYRSCDYVWLLDDDCTAQKTALEELLKWADDLSKSVKVGALRSARAWDKESGAPILEIDDLFAWRGTLIASWAVKNIGLPEDDLFLYGGDIEYGLRMRAEGYRIYMVFSSRIGSLELSEKVRGGSGLVRSEAYKQPFRIYYSFRNELIVQIKYARAGMVLRLLLHGFKNLCFFAVNDRGGQFRAVIEGIWDGLRGVRGKDRRYVPSNKA